MAACSCLVLAEEQAACSEVPHFGAFAVAGPAAFAAVPAGLLFEAFAVAGFAAVLVPEAAASAVGTAFALA